MSYSHYITRPKRIKGFIPLRKRMKPYYLTDYLENDSRCSKYYKEHDNNKDFDYIVHDFDYINDYDNTRNKDNINLIMNEHNVIHDDLHNHSYNLRKQPSIDYSVFYDDEHLDDCSYNSCNDSDYVDEDYSPCFKNQLLRRSSRIAKMERIDYSKFCS